MQVILDSDQLEAAREALNDSGSEELIDLMFRLSLRYPISSVTPSALEKARRLGWIDDKHALTQLGYLVADPLREYSFWRQRNRRLHSEDVDPLLSCEYYRGKSVLEIGCGFGCNLFSLAGVEGRFVGVEPVALYRQFTSLLAERENIACPEVVDGRGESLPFGEAEFDIVLCYSAHQYMDIKPALVEMARVLKSGGQLQIIGETFGPFLACMLRDAFRFRLASTKSDALTIVNTMTYVFLGRRLYTPKGVMATSAPVYPPKRTMNRWLERAGLAVRRDLFRRIDAESCFMAEKMPVGY